MNGIGRAIGSDSGDFFQELDDSYIVAEEIGYDSGEILTEEGAHTNYE
jgi:hypothetical protein